MSVSLLPRMMAGKLTDLTADMLHDIGTKLLMLDFDNTIVPYTTDIAAPEVLDWLERMKASDIQLCVVSNSHKERVREFCARHGIDCITHARKPFSKGICECLNRYEIAAQYCALVGDQIFTDTLGANGCGVKSILVKAIDNHNFWLKARHVLELPFVFTAKHRRKTLKI